MKIINKENGETVAYVQKKNLKAMLKHEKDMPRGVVSAIKALGYYEYDEHDEEFVRIEGKKEVSYISNLPWIMDYRKLRDLSSEDLETLITEETKKLQDMHAYYASLTPQEQRTQFTFPAQYALKNQTIKDIKAYQMNRQGKYDLPIEIPLVIDSDELQIDLDNFGYTAGISLDKNKIIFMKQNGKEITEEDCLPLPVVHSAMMMLAIESGIINATAGECGVKNYLDPTHTLIINEFVSIIEKAPEEVAEAANIPTHKEPTRVKQKSRFSQFIQGLGKRKKDEE